MIMTPGLRKAALVAHITSSVGWLGAVASFLVLSVVGLTGREADTVRSAYLAMNVTGQYAIVPLSLLALLTGLIQSLGTEWGLMRHYWVLVKFALTVGATLLLLLHQFTAVAGAAAIVSQAEAGTLPAVGRLGAQLVFDAAAALVVLIGITILSVYKPWGRTPFGRANPENQAARAGLPAGVKVLLVLIGLAGVIIVVVHLTGHAPMHHGR
jgi:hypothetical protein